MNPGPTPPRPDDDASDPLLAALRQRLGNYGQAPPPGAWAAIRGQLPPLPEARPWWRSRRLLPLLLLLLGVVGTGTVALLRGHLMLRSQLAKPGKVTLAHLPRSLPNLGQGLTKPKTSTQAISSAESASSAATNPAAPSWSSVPFSAGARAVAEGAAPHRLGKRLGLSSKAASATSSPSTRPAVAGKVATRAAAQLLKAQRTTHSTRPRQGSAPTSADQEPRSLALLAGQPAGLAARVARSVNKQPASDYAAPAPAPATTMPIAAATRPGRSGARPTNASYPLSTQRRSAQQAALLAAALPSASRRASAAATTQPSGTVAQPLASRAAGAASPLAPVILPSPVDSLAPRVAAWGVPLVLPLPALATRPDSVWPTLPKARRWSVLVLAGPTLSYRTLGPAPTLAAQHPDFARLERPALGLGAQVQVRRVLSGRWALAAGLGYHEYATRLALSLADTSAFSRRSVRQRDVYRVLTLPVQLSYALGPPRGRLSPALLLGIEPSWYLGGRSTEGSDCGCQQQTYTATSPRPYRTWSAAASLGFDLRYRLGGEAARWQWLVQPTARYIITPFVRSDAPYFTRRQPFSLGLLTGFSWDIR